MKAIQILIRAELERIASGYQHARGDDIVAIDQKLALQADHRSLLRCWDMTRAVGADEREIKREVDRILARAKLDASKRACSLIDWLETGCGSACLSGAL